MSAFVPAYRKLGPDDLWRRAEKAMASLADCRACPRDCRVNRLAGAWSACKTGRHAVVSSWFPHFGEEDCLRGWHGSGTYVNLMDQYYPAGKVNAAPFPEINRRLTSHEFQQARGVAADLGLRRLDERRPHARLAARRLFV